MVDMATACDNEDEIHTGYMGSGEYGVNPSTGSEFEVWVCACGQETMEVFLPPAPDDASELD